MKKNRRHRVSEKITAALLVALTMTVLACSPKPSPTTQTQGAAVKLVFTTQPAGAEAGSVLSTLPVVAAVDSNGIVVTGARNIAKLAITDNSGDSPVALFGATTVTPVKGIYNFKDLVIDKVGRYTLTATSSGLAPAVSQPFDIIPAETGARIVFSSEPSGGAAGSPFATQPVVTILDTYGNPVPNATDEISLLLSFSLEAPDAVLSGVTTVRAVNGVATFRGISVNKAGSFTLMAVISGLTSRESAVFTITPGAPDRLFFSTQPAGGPPGSPLTTMPPAIAVLVQDAYGNTVNGATHEITLAITPGTGTEGAVLSGVAKLKAVNGVADFEGLSIDKLGKGYTLTATASGLTPAVSDPFDIAPSPPPASSENTTTL